MKNETVIKLLNKALDEAKETRKIYGKSCGFDVVVGEKVEVNGEKLSSGVELIISMLGED